MQPTKISLGSFRNFDATPLNLKFRCPPPPNNDCSPVLRAAINSERGTSRTTDQVALAPNRSNEFPPGMPGNQFSTGTLST
jgi:hypothetical protein